MAIYCQDLDSLLPAYLDGELEGHEHSDLEAHLALCTACRARKNAESADHARLRQLLAAPSAPTHLRRDISAMLTRERSSRLGAPSTGVELGAAGGGAAMVAAAALALFALDINAPASAPSGESLNVALMQKDAVRNRFRGPLVTASSPADMTRSVAEYLRMPVTAPRVADSNIRGWQPTQLAGRSAAKLVYEVTAHQQRYLVDVHVLDGRDMGLDSGHRMMVNGNEFWVSTTSGIHTIAFKDPRGVGYVFSSDMPRGELIDLVVKSELIDQVNDRLFGE